jgi:membrane-associated phospholipid phosphatase
MMRPIARWLYPFDFPLLVYVALGLLCAQVYGLKIHWDVIWNFKYEWILLKQGVPIYLLLIYAHRMFIRGQLLPQMFDDATATLRSWRNWRVWYELLRTVIAVKLCMTIYTHLKQEIPLLHERLFDTQLHVIDRWLHLGLDPAALWRWLPWHWFSRSIDVLYIVWYVIEAPIILLFLFHPEPHKRWHFFTAFLLTWMVGGGLAILIPSLGPIYIQPKFYDGLAVPYAAQLQNMLWVHYQQLLADPSAYKVYIYEGIAAFPSLHVAIIVLFTLATRPWPLLFWPLLVYCGIVQFGSVYLGWHYAVDGYFGALMAVAIYFGLQPLFRPKILATDNSGEETAALG